MTPKSTDASEVMPPDLLAALASVPAAKARFDALPPSHRREHLAYINEAKKPETRARRIATTLEMLAGQVRRRD